LYLSDISGERGQGGNTQNDPGFALSTGEITKRRNGIQKNSV